MSFVTDYILLVLSRMFYHILSRILCSTHSIYVHLPFPSVPVSLLRYSGQQLPPWLLLLLAASLTAKLLKHAAECGDSYSKMKKNNFKLITKMLKIQVNQGLDFSSLIPVLFSMCFITELFCTLTEINYNLTCIT